MSKMLFMKPPSGTEIIPMAHWQLLPEVFYSKHSVGCVSLIVLDLLDFSIPNGLRFHVSSLSSPNFATSYTLGSVGLVDGSLSYIYTSLDLPNLNAKSDAINLHHLVPGYRQLQHLRQPDEAWWWEVWHQGRRIDRRGENYIHPRSLHVHLLNKCAVRDATLRSTLPSALNTWGAVPSPFEPQDPA